MRVFITRPRTPPLYIEGRLVNLSPQQVDITSLVEVETMRINKIYGSTVGSLNMMIRLGQGTLLPGYDVRVEDNGGTLLFGGFIQNVSLMNRGSYIGAQVACQDWTALLDHKSLSFIAEQQGETGLQIIRRAFDESGLSRDYSQGGEEMDVTRYPIPDNPIPPLNFAGASVSNIVNQIANLSSYVWWIDPYKRFHYTPVALSGQGLGISNRPGEDEEPLSSFSLSMQIARYNSVRIIGAQWYSEDVITNIYENPTRGKKTFDLTEGAQNTPTYAEQGETYIKVELNTGTEDVPVWTAQTVTFASEDTISNVKWSPLDKTITFINAPDVLPNSFRVSGRHVVSAIYQGGDRRSQRQLNRVFEHFITDPHLRYLESGPIKIVTSLRQNTGQFIIQTKLYGEEGPNGLPASLAIEPGETVYVSHSQYTLDGTNPMERVPVFVKQVSLKMLSARQVEAELVGNVAFPDLYSPGGLLD